jgi:uncharacterized repeat protein (TIGR03809 family)
MSRQSSGPSDRDACDQNIWERTDQAVMRWTRLTEKRRNHLLELYRSGRWRHYFPDEEALARELRSIARGIEEWRNLIPPEVTAPTATLAPDSTPAGNEASPLAPEIGGEQDDAPVDLPEFIRGGLPSRR